MTAPLTNDSDLTDGTTSSNHDRDLDQYGGQLRGSYELWPGVKPFVEIGADTRKHDLQFDRNGFYRDSNAITPKIGNYLLTSPRSSPARSRSAIRTGATRIRACRQLRGVVYDASLKYEATGLTTVTLNASSRADESGGRAAGPARSAATSASPSITRCGAG